MNFKVVSTMGACSVFPTIWNVGMWVESTEKEQCTNQAICDKLDIITPFNPLETFFGGRTNAIKLYHKVQDDE